MSIVTISRSYGSGGSEVATAVAEALGWPLLDNAVVDEVAARTGLSPDAVAAREERIPSFAERVASAMTLSTQEMLSPIARATFPPTEERILEVTRRVIEEAVARGPIVIVGRGAQMMLGARGDTFGVFCDAPREALVRRVMHRDGLQHAAAEKRVDEVNRQRAQWTRTHWGRDWRSPDTYHLCVNTDLLGIDGAAEAVVGAARRFFAS
jgi:cytidylate kinase